MTDKNYKTNRIDILFLTEFDELSDADYEAVGYLLTDSCAKYPGFKLLSERCAELYDASITNLSDFYEDMRGTAIRMTVIDDRYALEGEELEREACELLLECLLHPHTENGVFDPKTVRIVSAEISDAIRAKINDKRTYAAQKGAQTAYRGEPQSRPIEGTLEQAGKITPQSAWRVYKNMLERGRIEIIASGCSSFEQSERVFAEAFSKLDRSNVIELRKAKPSPVKPQPEYVTEKLPMQQAILRMYFKLPEADDRYAYSLLSLILGGMTTSRCFQNIREKQSLCYYCSTSGNRGKRALNVYAGVEPANVEKTKQAVLAEIRDICENGVTEEELKAAKLESLNSLTSLSDSPTALAVWYLRESLSGENVSPEEYIENMQAVTAERIQRICRMMKLDTVYVLEPEEDN